MKIIQGQDKVILRAVSPDGGTTSGDLLTAFAEDSGVTGIRISNLEVETQTTLNSTTTTIEDPFLEVNRNNSTADGEDAGIFFNRGSVDHALLYWDASDDNFVIGTTTHEATVTAVSNITLGQIKVATTPSNANHAASKSYVDSRTITVAGDDSAAITIDFDDAELVFTGGNSITTDTTAGGNSVKISVDAAMTGINSISSASGENITLTATSNLVVIDDFLTFANNQADPSAAAVSKFYAKTPGTGGTGLFVINSAIDGGEASELLGATSADLKIFGDDSTTMAVNLPTQEFHIKGGNGITTSTSSTQTLTISMDSELLTVNELSSADSTGITIKDDLLLAGTLRAEDSTTISVDGGMGVSGAIASGAITSSGVVTGTGFTIGSAVIDETDLEKLDGITNGAGAANKALVLDGSANIASGLAAVTASGVITAAGFTIGSAVINEAELETIDGVTAGTVAASKAVVVDSDKDITGGRNITLSGTLHTTILDVREINSTDSTAVVINEALEVAGALTSGAITSSGVVTGTGFTIGSAVIDETDLEKLDGITNGAGAANKALVLDASADVASGLAALTASGVITAAGFTIGSAVIGEAELEILDGATVTTAELNILDASAGNTAAASDVATSAGAVTSNNPKIQHTLTLNAELADDAVHADVTVTSDKCLATSTIIANANLNVQVRVHTVIGGSFKVSITNLSGGALANDSTIILNYTII